MRSIAQIEVVVCWLLWFYPFVRRARRQAQRTPEVTVSAGRWGILLQMLAMFLAWFYVPGPRSPALLATAMLLAPLATVCVWAAVPHLGKQWRIQAGLYKDHELVRTGPYRIVRHPIYASMLAMFLAAAFVMSTWQLWLPGLALMIAGIEIRVRVEDGLLASRFGGEFEAYKARVPAYIPFVR